MKKLMIVATAALWATVGLSIESNNTVGFQNKAVRQYLSQQVCTFDQMDVAGGTLDIQTLVPVDDNNAYIGDGAVNIQFYSNLGAFQGSYAYYGEGEYDDGFPAGWYDEGEDELADYTFEAGEGIEINTTEACVFKYSGEVNKAETDIPFRQFLSAQGNIRPTPVDIQSIIPVDDNGDFIGDGAVNIQFYSNLGAFQGSYAYYGAGEYDDDTPAGWYDEGEDELADYTFAAGEGFKISATQAGYLRFPEL